MTDGAWDGEEFIPFGGRLLVRLVCPKAGKVIGEVRSNAERGPLLWYRMNVLHDRLMCDDELPEQVSERILKVQQQWIVDRVSVRKDVLVTHLVEVPWGSKTQRRGRVRALNENRSVLPLAESADVISFGVGCEGCGSHSPDLTMVNNATVDAAKGPKPIRLVV